MVPEGKWAHSRIYEDIKVGIEVGHADDFWELPREIQSYLLAVYRIDGIKAAFEDKLREEEAKNTKPPKPGVHRGRR